MPIIQEIENLLSFYEKELDDTLNFWYKFGIDRKNGGFFTCLERDGTVYDSDKSVWAQGRGLWVFSKAYNDIKKDDRYIEAAEKSYRFIKQHCYDNDGTIEWAPVFNAWKAAGVKNRTVSLWVRGFANGESILLKHTLTFDANGNWTISD